MRDGSLDPKRIVRTGYDTISEAYRPDTLDLGGTWYATALDALDHFLPTGSRVLDLGCGCGVPIAQRLARTHTVTGVDISDRQIQRARTLVPEASFVRADMTSLDLPRHAFDAIVSFYAVIHVPLEEQPALFDAFVRWLTPDGLLCVIVGNTAGTGTEDDWYGAPMYWSHGDRNSYASLFEARGFDVVDEWFIPEGDGGHIAFLARSTGSDGVGTRR